MTFQPGNTLAKLKNGRERICAQRLIAELKSADPQGTQKLYRLVNALLNKALEGDVVAIKEVMDRVDGRVPQQIGGDPDNPLTVEAITRTIVRPIAFQQQNPIAPNTTGQQQNTAIALGYKDPSEAA